MATVTKYYAGGFNAGAPQQNRAEEWTATTYTRWSVAGAVLETRPLTAVESNLLTAQDTAETQRLNEVTLRDKARQAIASNDAFLADPSPSNQQVITQVQRLTRQNTALIRLVVGALDSTDGT